MKTDVLISSDGKTFTPSTGMCTPMRVRTCKEVALAHFLSTQLENQDPFHLLTLIHIHKRARFEQSWLGRMRRSIRKHMSITPQPARA